MSLSFLPIAILSAHVLLCFSHLLEMFLSQLPSRFVLQLVGVLLDDISSRRVKVDITEQQHTFYCQQLGTLLMCLIHVFKSGENWSFSILVVSTNVAS